MDRWLTRMYERGRARYLLATMLVGGVAAAGVLGPVALTFGARYYGLDVGEYVAVVLQSWLITAVIGLILLTVIGRRLAALLSWARGDRSRGLEDRVATFAFDIQRELVLPISAAVVPVGIAAGGLLLTTSGYTSVTDWIDVGLAVLQTVVLAAIVLSVCATVAIRPLVAELAEKGRSPDRRGRLMTGVMVGIVAIMLSVSTVVGSASADRHTDGAGAFVGNFGVSVVVTAMFAVVAGPLLISSILGPTRTLTAATRRVSNGRLDRTVPVVTTDEFAELALRFNEMLEGLRERQELRERNAALVDELRASQARLVAAADESRRRVERELRDGVQADLFRLTGKLARAAEALGDDPAALAGALEECCDELDAAITQLRDFAHGLYPQVLAADGLEAALEEAARSSPLKVRTHLGDGGRCSPAIEAAVYFCCLEALQSIGAHETESASPQINLEREGGRLSFEIADGLAGNDGRAAFAGLQNMSDRIGALGGELTLRYGLAQGTTLRGSVPLGDNAELPA